MKCQCDCDAELWFELKGHEAHAAPEQIGSNEEVCATSQEDTRGGKPSRPMCWRHKAHSLFTSPLAAAYHFNTVRLHCHFILPMTTSVEFCTLSLAFWAHNSFCGPNIFMLGQFLFKLEDEKCWLFIKPTGWFTSQVNQGCPTLFLEMYCPVL